MHGYANGAARQPGKSPPWEAHDGPDEAYPDAWVAAEAVATLQGTRRTEAAVVLRRRFFQAAPALSPRPKRNGTTCTRRAFPI
jgi:hypothetical protein